MGQSLTVIDSFSVTADLQPQLQGMSIGNWYVLEGPFSDKSELPAAGAQVLIRTPAGVVVQAMLAEAQVRHGSAALRFQPDPSPVPRLSVVELAP
jgi:hypothetical protein